MKTFENQTFTTTNGDIVVKVVLILISAISVVLISTLLHLSYIRGGDEMINYAAGILLAIVLVSWTMWPAKRDLSKWDAEYYDLQDRMMMDKGSDELPF